MRLIRLFSPLLGTLLVLVAWGAGLVQAQKPVVVHVYSATDSAAFTPLIEAFEASRPDIDIEYREFNTAELYEEVLANRERAGFEADVIISSAMDLQVKLVNQGLALPLDSLVGTFPPDWASWRGELLGFTYEPVSLVYNRAAFKGRDLPASHSDLASMIRDDPDFFDGHLGTFNAYLSGVGYLFATQDEVQGQNAARLVESLGRARVRLFCCSEDMMDGVASGDLVLAYNVIGSYALDRASRDSRIGVHFMSDYTLIMSRSAFVLKKTPVPHAAAAFVQFLLSVEGQSLIGTTSSLIPLSESARVQDAVRALTEGIRVAPVPIKLGPGLLVYLDTMKKKAFLGNWGASIRPPQSDD
ncbi:MAG: ABC transporter substrate-binding protein [Rhodospirillum sp.]|nr:ABC transporter substrate-binding protein [Rhodospirillum sp.]MCF8490980.1 ABC transporter substrate-binding protein [Rhodospirillum sp.]MCF8501193.1 ABC transporter substrate-binding protein [Rhodospirillum sp.]